MQVPVIFISDKWKDYCLIDAGGGRRLERWGKYILNRPDPQAMWPVSDASLWNADAVYHRSKSGGGSWEFKVHLPEHWLISYNQLIFKVRPTGFKHTGLFPEQAVNWEYINGKVISADRPVKVLNLFGYTGGATIAAAAAGAEVTHVDSSKGMLGWCRENAVLSKIKDGFIRYIPEDCLRFAERELKRGNRYDAVIMDPPSFGRGAKGEVWKLEDDLMRLLDVSSKLLTDNPLFFLLNSYTAGISPIVAANMLNFAEMAFNSLSYGELVLPFGAESFLPCGICCRMD